ncbi:unnamed protein product [Prunus armeniaca]
MKVRCGTLSEGMKEKCWMMETRSLECSYSDQQLPKSKSTPKGKGMAGAATIGSLTFFGSTPKG